MPENCVYVAVPAKGEGLTKVGSSRRPEGRASGLSLDSGARMKIVAVYVIDGGRADALAVEHVAHSILAADLARGREWFAVTAGRASEAVRDAANRIGLVATERPVAEARSSRFASLGDCVQDVLRHFNINRADLEADCAAWLERVGPEFKWSITP